MKTLALVGVAFTLLLPIAIAVAEPAAKDLAHSQTAGVLVQAHDIPQPVQTVITNGSMGKKYEVSFYLSPFYLRGDLPRRGLATASNLWLRRNEKLARNQNVNIPLLFLSLS